MPLTPCLSLELMYRAAKGRPIFLRSEIKDTPYLQNRALNHPVSAGIELTEIFAIDVSDTR